MTMADEPWLPGSFTKNFSWGKDRGLEALHEHIRIGFDGKLEPVPREEYRRRVSQIQRPDFIPLNFFLFNQIVNGESYVVVDELVFQALTAEHSRRFDLLALFAFNLSMVGLWKGATRGQRYPALWAKHYITDHLATELKWDVGNVSKNDIVSFLRESPQFKAKTSFDKIATNLSFMYLIGGLQDFRSERIERWWVDALFLALDRIVADEAIDGKVLATHALPKRILKSGFAKLTGIATPEKNFAMAHLLTLYTVCGGSNRFQPDKVKEGILVRIPDYVDNIPNDPRPPGALHPTNPRILKTIPRSCAPLAESVGFQIVYPDDLDGFDPSEFVRSRTASAINNLEETGIVPKLSSEELHKLTRDK